MDRRRLLEIAASAILVSPFVAEAQQGGKVPRIGILNQGRSPTAEETGKSPWARALRDLGWVEGKTIIFERRHAQGQAEKLPSLAAELVRIPVDVIWAASPPAAVAARNATTTIPIVFAGVVDPVALGFAQSLARPGGNLTGVAFATGPEVAAKQLQLLKELVPGARRVAYLYNAENQASTVYLPAIETAASRLGLALKPLGVRRPEDYDGAFAAMRAWSAEALMLIGDPLHIMNRTRIVEFAARHRLPATFGLRPFAEAGGLASYSPSADESARRGAAIMDRVLRGTKPGEIPIEQPTKFELVINLKTAKALGLTIPPSLLLRADQVIE